MSSDVDKIKSRLSIVDVVSPYVQLKPAGNRLKGLSPFTREKTPSFFVSPEQGFYHCFSTDQGGDMFSFIQTIEGLDFPGALRFLADKAGVELTNNRSSDNSQKKDIYDALEAANNFFQASFKVATVAQHFVKGRGISPDQIKAFNIGYAPDDWRRLHEALSKKFSDDILLAAGLVKQKNQNTYDVFRDRVMFPIRDIAGRVVGFSGRRLDGEKAAKYLNSPESVVFKKSEILYGLYEGRNVIRQLGFVIVVEGQVDLVLAHQSGSQNTVASSGTAFTPKHLEIIKRYSENILLALDSDSAGIKAAIKIAELAYQQGMIVKAVDLPEGSDPADMIAGNVADWHRVIKQSVSLPYLLVKKIKDNNRNETHFTQVLSKVVIPLIALIQSPIQQQKELEGIAEISELPFKVVEEELLEYKKRAKLKYTNQNITPTSTKVVDSKRPDNSGDSKLETDERILKSISEKVALIKHHFPEAQLPNLPVSTNELPQPDTAKLLANDVKNESQLIRELSQLSTDYALRVRAKLIDDQLALLEVKKDKTADDINEIIRLRKVLEDLPLSSD